MMRTIGRVRAIAVLMAFLFCSGSLPPSAQAIPSDATRLEHQAIQHAALYRHGKRLFVVPDQSASSGTAVVPRFCGRLRLTRWRGSDHSAAITLHPEPGEWVLKWDEMPVDAEAIELEFDQEPRLPSELTPVAAMGDGSVMLHAYQAMPEGEKLRYEPQPFKNTIGYWTVASDTVAWRLHVRAAGQFNVAILQGCGAGHGGSAASVHLQKDEQTIAAIDFDVLETGHFQDFQWRHLGRVSLPTPGVYTLRIAAKEIKHGALMDVRAVHLVRLPSKQK